MAIHEGTGTSQSELGWNVMPQANQNELQTVCGITRGHLKNSRIRKEERVNFTLRCCQCIWSSSQSRCCKMCVPQTQPTVPPVDKDNPVEPTVCSTWNRSTCWNESGHRSRKEMKCLILMTKEIESCFGISVGNEGWNCGPGCLFSFSPTVKAYSLRGGKRWYYLQWTHLTVKGKSFWG